MTTAILPLGRPTFDVPFANEKLAAMLARLDATGRPFTGPRELLFDADATRKALAELREQAIEQLLVLQVTFTDASMTVEAADALGLPMAIWAIPEPRIGGRLRLNSFCGLNLASHALGLNDRRFSWLYGDPETVADEDIAMLLDGRRLSGRIDGAPADADPALGARLRDAVSGRKIGRIGEHPVGFHTCAYSKQKLLALGGVTVDELELGELFETARGADDDSLAAVRKSAMAQLHDLDEVNQDELDRSLRLKVALEQLRKGGKYDAFAIRCWPETFTEYGGAVCGPVAMMGEARVPCACEADVYGAFTQMLLQEAAAAPVFLTDLVDVDRQDDSAVVWHCGQAPLSMCAPETAPSATIHTNRKMPLLYQFPLKAGRITLMRISQAFGEPKMILAGAEMLDREMAFTGTSGVLRFDRPAGEVLDDIIASGLEHHMALAYGEHRPLLRSLAASMQLPVLEL
ncbi:MAG: hypothetical protein WBO55_19190 [Rhizobiaceae bacterium]